MGTSLENTIRVMAKNRNNTHFMLVDGMSKLLNQKVKQCRSSDFYAFDLKWNIIIRTNEDDSNYLSFYLKIVDNQIPEFNLSEMEFPEVKCSFKLSVLSQTYERDISKGFPLQSFDVFQNSIGDDDFVSYWALSKKCIVDDKAVFCAEITYFDPHFNVTYKNRTNQGTAERLTLMEVPRNNSKFTWKITRFSSFAGESHSSYEFNVGQRRWRLKMYPKGNLDEDGDGHLSLYLTATGYVTNSPKAPTVAVYKLRVLDQRTRNHYAPYCCEYVFPIDPNKISESYGVSGFLPLDELHNTSRGLLVDDEIYLGVEFLYVSTTEIL